MKTDPVSETLRARKIKIIVNVHIIITFTVVVS
jgi:hypothetical protein